AAVLLRESAAILGDGLRHANIRLDAAMNAPSPAATYFAPLVHAFRRCLRGVRWFRLAAIRVWLEDRLLISGHGRAACRCRSIVRVCDNTFRPCLLRRCLIDWRMVRKPKPQFKFSHQNLLRVPAYYRASAFLRRPSLCPLTALIAAPYVPLKAQKHRF